MPVSAYLKAGLFVVAAAAALFAAAGTVAIPGFWVYLAIFTVVMIVSFAALDPDLLHERMRPEGKKPPRATPREAPTETSTARPPVGKTIPRTRGRSVRLGSHPLCSR